MTTEFLLYMLQNTANFYIFLISDALKDSLIPDTTTRNQVFFWVILLARKGKEYRKPAVE